MLVGTGIAWWTTRPDMSMAKGGVFANFAHVAANRFYLDEIFLAVLVIPIQVFSYVVAYFDDQLVDGLIRGLAKTPGEYRRTFQTIPNRNHLPVLFDSVRWRAYFGRSYCSRRCIKKTMSGILPLLILLPLIGGVLLLTVGTKAQLIPARRTSLAVSGMTLLLSIILASGIWSGGSVGQGDASTRTSSVSSAEGPNPDGLGRASIQPMLEFRPTWLAVQGIGGVTLQMSLGVDSLGMAMTLLTTITVLVVLLSATLSISRTYISYAGWILLAEAGLLTRLLSDGLAILLRWL